ncbi:MAG: rhombosortase [Candidatus Thiodiazotropha sp.]
MIVGIEGGKMQTAEGPGWLIPVVIAIFSLCFQLAGDSSLQWLRFDHDAIAAGFVWRLLTGHLVHLGWSHLLLNLAGLFITWALVGESMSNRCWLLLLLFSSLAITSALWFFNPQLHWYVGLSGVLHAMMLGGAIVLFWRGDRGTLILIVLVVIKLIWEQLEGPLPGSEAASGGAVIVDAHLYGAVAGVLFACFLLRLTKPGKEDGEPGERAGRSGSSAPSD